MEIAYLEFNPKLENEIIRAFKNVDEFEVKIKGHKLILPLVVDAHGGVIENVKYILDKHNYFKMVYTPCGSMQELLGMQRVLLEKVARRSKLGGLDVIVVYPKGANLEHIKGAFSLWKQQLDK